MLKFFRTALLAASFLVAGTPAFAGTTLCNLGITTAVTALVQNVVAGFGKPQALSLQARFTYVASAATSVDAYVQSTM